VLVATGVRLTSGIGVIEHTYSKLERRIEHGRGRSLSLCTNQVSILITPMPLSMDSPLLAGEASWGGVFLSNDLRCKTASSRAIPQRWPGRSLCERMRACSPMFVRNNIAENTASVRHLQLSQQSRGELCSVWNSACVAVGVSMFHGQVVNCVISGNTAARAVEYIAPAQHDSELHDQRNAAQTGGRGRIFGEPFAIHHL